MKKIYILWASIRPDFVLTTSKKWLDNCVYKDRLFFKIATATEEQKELIETFNLPNSEIISVTEKPGYNYAITQLTKNIEVEDDDILLLLSDDFNCLPSWDEFIYRKFEDWDGAILLDDGVQDVDIKCGELCITLACMTFKCLKQINKVVFSPNYFHFYSDNEAYHNLNDLGLLKDTRDVDNFTFKHEHYTSGFRAKDLHDDKAGDGVLHDAGVYNLRKQMNVHERLNTILG